MSIIINNFEILSGGTQLAIDVETTSPNKIVSILLWSVNGFKDYSQAMDISQLLEGVNNKEVLIVNNYDVSIDRFEDIYFMEVQDDKMDESEQPSDPVLGITYNLSAYYGCLMEYLSDLSANQCVTCNNSANTDAVIMVNMMIDTIVKSIEIGYYSQAIETVEKLKKICSLKKCDNCETVECTSCNKFIQV